MFLRNPITFELRKEEIVPNIQKEAKFRFQRAQRGYADADLWNFETFIAGVLCNGLRDLKENIGTPCADYKGHELTHEEWKDILDEMADGFCFYADHKDDFWEITDREEIQKRMNEVETKLKRSCKLLGKWFGALWW